MKKEKKPGRPPLSAGEKTLKRIISFPESLWKRAQEMASREGEKTSVVIRKALENFLD